MRAAPVGRPARGLLFGLGGLCAAGGAAGTAGPGSARPCSATVRENCTHGRFRPCGSTRALGASTAAAGEFAGCQQGPLGSVAPGQAVLVQFTQGRPEQGGECTEIQMRVGEMWGHDGDGDLYDCQGRCGVACQLHDKGACSNWSRNCLQHDVCSYYYNSRGGALDRSCGHLFAAAARDFAVDCFVDHRCQLPGFNREAEVRSTLEQLEGLDRQKEPPPRRGRSPSSSSFLLLPWM